MTPDAVRAIVFRHLHEIVPGTAVREVDADAPLNEIGADSLDLLDVTSRSMQELGVKIPRTEVTSIRTLNDLVAVLHRVKAAQAA
jgi:acyl carrier protein/polyketide biosynthesis acyl carrier protein